MFTQCSHIFFSISRFSDVLTDIDGYFGSINNSCSILGRHFMSDTVNGSGYVGHRQHRQLFYYLPDVPSTVM